MGSGSPSAKHQYDGLREPDASPAACRRGVPAKILVVDGEVDNAETTDQLLRLYGHDVRIAFEGHRAIALARDWRPDFVLLDMRLPGLDGYRVASRIRQESGGRVVIVAITSYGSEEDRLRAIAAGCGHHFTKPAEPADLLELLSRPRGEQPPGVGGPIAADAACALVHHRMLEITNILGLHLRAADKFARLTRTFRSEVRVGCDGRKADGRSVLDLTLLAAEMGLWVELEVEGPDAESALDALAGLIGRGFGEEVGVGSPATPMPAGPFSAPARLCPADIDLSGPLEPVRHLRSPGREVFPR